MTSAPFVNSVLHPTDFSAASERAFAHALVIALLRQTDLTILHVSRSKPSDDDWTQFPPVRRTLERWGLLESGSPRSAVFDEFRVKVKKVVLQGHSPVLATAAFLDREPSDLIVLATEGGEGLSRLVDRSDAEAMARWSHTMTLFVPEHAKRSLVSMNGDIHLRNILVPFDRSPDCRAALEYAMRAAETLADEKVTITLVHIGDASPPLPALPEGAYWTWQTEHRQGDAVDGILSSASRNQADLIIMTTAGHDSVLDALRGSTTEQVLRQAPCPLLAVPAAQ